MTITHTTIIILGLIIIFTFYVTYARYVSSNPIPTISLKTHEQTVTELKEMRDRANYLAKIKFADENIFNYIRCINIPQAPTCAPANRSNDPNKGIICRSRQIDCNKLKLVLENDPVAVNRMKVATDRFYQTGQPSNLSELTHPVTNNWWFF